MWIFAIWQAFNNNGSGGALIYSRKGEVMDDEQNGYVSIWAGNFTSEEQLHTYLATVYQGEDETDEAFSQKLESFLPENQHRTCEEEFKALYDEFYNQFEYDFGLTFDEDFVKRYFTKRLQTN